MGEREEEREPGPPVPWNSRRAGTPRSLGPDALHIHLAPAGRWGRWSVLPACQLAQDAWWLAPWPLGWAAGPPPTGMQLAARSRWAGRSGPWLSDKLPAGFAAPGALAPLGWHCWAGGPTCWLPMDGQLAWAAARRALLNVGRPWPVGIEARTHPAVTITLKRLQGEQASSPTLSVTCVEFRKLQSPRDTPHSCTLTLTAVASFVCLGWGGPWQAPHSPPAPVCLPQSLTTCPLSAWLSFCSRQRTGPVEGWDSGETPWERPGDVGSSPGMSPGLHSHDLDPSLSFSGPRFSSPSKVKKSYGIAHGALLSVMWQPGWEGSSGENESESHTVVSNSLRSHGL